MKEHKYWMQQESRGAWKMPRKRIIITRRSRLYKFTRARKSSSDQPSLRQIYLSSLRLTCTCMLFEYCKNGLSECVQEKSSISLKEKPLTYFAHTHTQKTFLQIFFLDIVHRECIRPERVFHQTTISKRMQMIR